MQGKGDQGITVAALSGIYDPRYAVDISLYFFDITVFGAACGENNIVVG